MENKKPYSRAAGEKKADGYQNGRLPRDHRVVRSEGDRSRPRRDGSSGRDHSDDRRAKDSRSDNRNELRPGSSFGGDPQRHDRTGLRPARWKESDAEEHSAENTGSIHGDYENGAVIGRNAVRELLKTDRPVDKLLVQRGERTGSIVVLVAQAIDRGIPVIETEKSKLDAIAGFAPHQGIIALAAEKEYCTVDDILAIARDKGEDPLIVLCDGITDPYNLGAIIRCAECCGVHGLVIPKRRATGLTPLVSKASAGAIEHLAVAKVSNIASTVELLKKRGLWVYAAEAGGTSIYRSDFKGPCAVVLGSEGNGVSPLVLKLCDATVSIPMYGQVNSFNVSTAAAILLAEIAHQNHPEN